MFNKRLHYEAARKSTRGYMMKKRRLRTEGDSELRKGIRGQLEVLFASQKFAVLSTNDHGQPYNNLVAFLASADLLRIIFATARSTRKYANIESEPRVSLLVDNRRNKDSDIRRAMAVTALGRVVQVTEAEHERYRELFIAKHPYLGEFVSTPTTALICVDLEQYYVVSRFQNVTLLDLKEWL
jgi:heme iron utilization protein